MNSILIAYTTLLSISTLFASVVSKELDDTEWIVYDPEDFDKNELCSILSCAEGDLCLVRNNNAMCSSADQLQEITSPKKFFKQTNSAASDDVSITKNDPSATSADDDSRNPLDNREWDQEELDQKLENLKNEPKLLVGRERQNEMHYEPDVTIVDHNDRPADAHQRHGVQSGSHENCTLQELEAIKGRLFKWFSDLHEIQKNEVFYELPKHDISCHADVGFMFNTLDGDKNGKLALDELYSVDNDPHEKCVKPFLDRCDIDSDDDLSLNEWCSCFQWSNDEFHEPSCHAALRKHNPHDPHSFLPNCDSEGFYNLDQCHKGVCWCVDKWGREFDRSRTFKGKVNCKKYVL